MLKLGIVNAIAIRREQAVSVACHSNSETGMTPGAGLKYCAGRYLT